MDFEIVYPHIKKHSIAMVYVRTVFGLLFLAAAAVCPVVNLILGGKAWSVLVLWSLYMVWTLVLRQPLVGAVAGKAGHIHLHQSAADIGQGGAL